MAGRETSIWARTTPRPAAPRSTPLIPAGSAPPAGTSGAAATAWRWTTATGWSPHTTTWNPSPCGPATRCGPARPSPASVPQGGPQAATCISRPSSTDATSTRSPGPSCRSPRSQACRPDVRASPSGHSPMQQPAGHPGGGSKDRKVRRRRPPLRSARHLRLCLRRRCPIRPRRPHRLRHHGFQHHSLQQHPPPRRRHLRPQSLRPPPQRPPRLPNRNPALETQPLPPRFPRIQRQAKRRR